jgi:hypothetical protein
MPVAAGTVTEVDIDAALDDLDSRPLPAGDSVFTSPWWLRACERTWPSTPARQVLSIGLGAGRRCHALLGRRTVLRGGLLRRRRLALNETLDARHDEVTVELNGLYGCRDEDFGEAVEALLRWLAGRSDWDELVLSGLAQARALDVERAAHRAGLHVRTDRDVPSFSIDLERVRATQGGEYLAALSSNARQRLRRAERGLESALGPVAFERAASAAQVQTWFGELERLHRARWGRGAGGSCFDLPPFVAFHRSLMEQALDAGALQLDRLSAGDTAVAYLYNLVYGGRVHFILGGIDLARAGEHSPGLLIHRRAIERSLRDGAKHYDFLAGSGRYKATLGTQEDRQRWLTVWRPGPVAAVENALRGLRRRWRRAPPAPGPAR